MGKLNYNTQPIEDANKEFEALAEDYATTADEIREDNAQYVGDEGWNKALENTTNYADKIAGNVGKTAANNALAAARSAGMNKSKAAITSAQLASKASLDAYNNAASTGLSSALGNNDRSLQNNNNYLASQQQNVANAQQNITNQTNTEDKKYNATKDTVSAYTEAGSAALGGITNIFKPKIG